MYLSRVQIDTFNRINMKQLTHVGAIHNWVEKSFPYEFKSNIRTRKLWRIDELDGNKYLLIVSEEKPSIKELEEFGVKDTGLIKNYDKFLNSIKEGQKRLFRVTLNPVVSISRGSNNRGRVVPILTVDKQMKFLKDRSIKNGFSIENNEYAIVDKGYSTLKKSGEKDLKIIRVTYQGILTIEDVDKFRKTLTEGFGKKKAYGFGMMTVI